MESIYAILTDRLLLLCLALPIAMLCFGPPALYRALGLGAPKRWITAMLQWLAHKLNRQRRSAGTLVYRGIILLCFAMALAVMFGVLIHKAYVNYPVQIWLEIFLIAWLIPIRPCRDLAAQLGRHVRAKREQKAQALIAQMHRRQITQLDVHGMYRAGIEYLAESLSDSIIAPALWYLLFGLPGLCAVRMIHLLDQLVGYRSKTLLAFGWAPAKMDDLVQYIPARITALLLWIASLFVPKTLPLAAISTSIREAGKTASPNAGWPMAAFAGALRISLGGPRKQADAVIEDAWIGQGTAKVNRHHYRRAQVLFAFAVIGFWFMCLLALAFLSESLPSFSEWIASSGEIAYIPSSLMRMELT